jgi:hypothetical protein
LAPVWALDVRSASTGPSACTPMRSLKFIIFKAIIVTDTPPKSFFSYGFLMPYWGQQEYSFLKVCNGLWQKWACFVIFVMESIEVMEDGIDEQ